MKRTTPPSLFRMIELFRKGTQRTLQIFNTKVHCEEQALHDYYCDKEQTLI